MRAELDLSPGTELPPLTTEPLSRLTLALYCGASGDHFPLHVDIDWVRENTQLPDVIGHGMLTMAYLGRMLSRTFEPEEIRALSTRFLAPTEIGDEIICRGVVESVGEDGGKREATLSLTAQTRAGKTVATGNARIRVASDRRD